MMDWSINAISTTSARGGYAKRLVQAHRLHHATVGKEGGVSFGFVIARDPAALKKNWPSSARRESRCCVRLKRSETVFTAHAICALGRALQKRR
jgi:hypothetical protein